MSLRAVKSPLAPNMTMAHGSTTFRPNSNRQVNNSSKGSACSIDATQWRSRLRVSTTLAGEEGRGDGARFLHSHNYFESCVLGQAARAPIGAPRGGRGPHSVHRCVHGAHRRAERRFDRSSGYLRLHQSISSRPVRFGYDRGTHSLSKSKYGENLFNSSPRVVPNGGPSSSGIR